MKFYFIAHFSFQLVSDLQSHRFLRQNTTDRQREQHRVFYLKHFTSVHILFHIELVHFFVQTIHTEFDPMSHHSSLLMTKHQIDLNDSSIDSSVASLQVYSFACVENYSGAEYSVRLDFNCTNVGRSDGH